MLRIKALCIIIFFPFLAIGQVEICNNGIDDDNDQLIDLNDDDCDCMLIEPVSLIPNPSFEETNCCPSDRSQLDCATDWIQASEPTTDFIHNCGWLGWDDFPPPLPFPDGNGIMGFRDGRVRRNSGDADPQWKEYAGACLISPLIANTTYRFQFDVGFITSTISPPINISFFGTADCINLPFGVGNDDFGCPSNGSNWVKLGDVFVNGSTGNRWINTFLEVTPTFNINAIAIGPDCAPVPSAVSTYYYFDNLLLADFESFVLQISETGHPCSPDFSLSIPFNSNYDYQWYKDGVALINESSADLSMNYGEGSYQVRIEDGISCRVSAAYIYEVPKILAPLMISICEGDSYSFGSLNLSEEGAYIDTFKNSNNCDSIVNLDLSVIGSQYDTLEATILRGETLQVETFSFSNEGEFPITLTSTSGCDSLVLVNINYFDIFFPNVFSPNFDGINDIFLPTAPNERIVSVDMKIFDRWGNFLHQGPEWNGRSNDEKVNTGVYVYIAEITFNDGLMKVFSGSVSVIK